LNCSLRRVIVTDQENALFVALQTFKQKWNPELFHFRMGAIEAAEMLVSADCRQRLVAELGLGISM
jgi:hypothetical protein